MATGLILLAMEHGARPQASAIYAKIGIDLKWSHFSECVNDGIRIEVEPKAAADLSPKATATAYPFSRSPQRITVYRDRVQAVISGRGLSAAFILGHILAHEIGYVLLRTDAHADTGAHESTMDERRLFGDVAGSRGFQRHARKDDAGNLDRRALMVE